MHLIVDGYGCDPERLSNVDIVQRFLGDTPDAIGMKRISPVYVCQLQGEDDGQNGVSGFVIIAESHIAIHTWPERGTVWADIFSCKSFDVERVQQVLMETFDIKRMDVDVLPRGLDVDVMEGALVTVGESAIPFLRGSCR